MPRSLTVEQRQVVRGVAHKMGFPLKYQPTFEDARALLAAALNYALAMAATSPNHRERERWNREVIRARLALEGPAGRKN